MIFYVFLRFFNDFLTIFDDFWTIFERFWFSVNLLFLSGSFYSGLLVVLKIGIWSRIRNFPKKRSDLSRFSEHWWNSDLFSPVNFENWSFGSKVMHFFSILSFKMLEARKCSEFVPNFVSFGAFCHEKWLLFSKCSELALNFTLCGDFNSEKKMTFGT